MSQTYEELYNEFTIFNLSSISEEQIDSLVFAEREGQWVCCCRATQPLNGHGDEDIVPVAFEVLGRLGDEDEISMVPTGDSEDEDEWFAYWHIEAMGEGPGHREVWNKVQESITKITRHAPFHVQTSNILHHNPHTGRVTLKFYWELGMPCVYVESDENASIVCTISTQRPHC